MNAKERLEQAKRAVSRAIQYKHQCEKASDDAAADLAEANRELREARECERAARYAVGQRDIAMRCSYLRPNEADALSGEDIEDIYGIPDEQGCLYVPDALLTPAQRETWARFQDKRAKDEADPFARDEGRRA